MGRDWELDAGARARIDVELETITIAQAQKFPTCELCNQLTREKDRFGLCTRTDERHRVWRQNPANRDAQ